MQFHFIPKKHIPVALLILIALLALRYILPFVMPVLLGFLLALALSSLIGKLQERSGLSRSAAALVTIIGILGLLSALVFFSIRFLMHGAERFSSLLPELFLAASGYISSFVSWVDGLTGSLPQGASDALSSWTDGLLNAGGTLATGLYERVFSLVSDFLGSLPDHLLFLITLLLSCYFAAAELPRLRELLELHLPRQHLTKWRDILSGGKSVLAGWFRAQLKLMGITFLVLLVGFLFLRIQLPFLFALGIALLDALPLLGTGIILLPWGLLSMVSGELSKGIGLIVIYGIAALLRNVLEPKFLGDQMGISPLLSLLSLYAGYRISGFWGMILLPLGVMVFAEIYTGRKLSRGNFNGI